MAQRRDGLYKRGRYWWHRDPVSGERETTRCTDLEAARRYRAARERLGADPAHATAQTARLDEWIGRLIALKENAGAAKPTLNVYRTKLGHALRIFGADAMLSSVDPDRVDAYVKARRAEGVTDHTISKEYGCLVTVLRLAKRGRAYGGDLTVLRPPDLHAGYKPRKRALSRPEIARLLSQLGPELAALTLLCIALGCRLSEAQRLLPTDVDLVRGRVHIGGTKTEDADRSVPVLSLYRPLLETALPFLPLRPRCNIVRDLKAACRRAGIEPCTPNDLRRTHATLLAEAGVDRDVTRRLLGHTTPALVDRVYGQPSTDALAVLAESRLQAAEPVQLRHNETPAAGAAAEETAEKKADCRFSSVVEQRFRKPDSGDEKQAEVAESSSQTPTSADEDRRDSLRSGTSTSQRPGLARCPSTWALGYAALAVGALPPEGAL